MLISKILEDRFNSELGRREFKVHWLGYSLEECTWESPGTLEGLEQFDAYLKATASDLAF